MGKPAMHILHCTICSENAGDKYGFDVKSRKAEIKTMAVEYCNRRLAGEDNKEEGGTGDVDKEEQQELETVQPHLEESNEVKLSDFCDLLVLIYFICIFQIAHVKQM